MSDLEKNQGLYGNQKKETKIKLSPGDQAMIDDMDKPIEWDKISKIAEAYFEERERKKAAHQEK
jgi:hypothetical protein